MSEAVEVAVVGPQVLWRLQGINSSGTINFASSARLGDLGSSRVNADPTKTVSPCDGLKAQAPAGVTQFRVTFTNPGTYPYICAFHDQLGMKGELIVLP